MALLSYFKINCINQIAAIYLVQDCKYCITLVANVLVTDGQQACWPNIKEGMQIPNFQEI